MGFFLPMLVLLWNIYSNLPPQVKQYTQLYDYDKYKEIQIASYMYFYPSVIYVTLQATSYSHIFYNLIVWCCAFCYFISYFIYFCCGYKVYGLNDGVGEVLKTLWVHRISHMHDGMHKTAIFIKRVFLYFWLWFNVLRFLVVYMYVILWHVERLSFILKSFTTLLVEHFT